MGREYRARVKEKYGKQAVVAYETLEVGGSLGAGAAAAAALGDRQSITTYTTKRPAKLDAITIQLDAATAAGSGQIWVRALVNGLEVGSGIVPAGLSRGDVTFETEKGEEVRLSIDDTLVLDVTKGATAAAHSITARAALRLYEI